MRKISPLLLMGLFLAPLAGCDLEDLEEVNINVGGYPSYSSGYAYGYDTIIVEDTYYYDEYYYPDYGWYWWW